MPDMNDAPELPIYVSLEENLHLHAIGAEVFAPFVIDGVSPGRNAEFAEFTIRLTDEHGQNQTKVVHLTWKLQSNATKPFVVQERVMTEWGALGVALALIPTLLGFRVLSVALEGERFDYRIGDDTVEWALEVSGTLSESVNNLRERHRVKARQLRENPARLSGNVVIVGFTLHEVLVSFDVP